MTGHSVERLSPEAKTMFVCLLERAAESVRPDAVLRDPAAVEIASHLEVDPAGRPSSSLLQLATSIRTAMFDQRLRTLLAENPGAVVVNLGSGLCTRSIRIPDGWSHWYDVDQPAVQELWDRWIGATNRRSFVAADLEDPSWLDALDLGRAIPVFIAEGSLLYVERVAVVALLQAIADTAGRADLLLDALGPGAPALTVLNRSVNRTGARFKWGVRSLRELTDWCPGLVVCSEWCYLDERPERWGLPASARRLPLLRRQLKAGHLRI